MDKKEYLEFGYSHAAGDGAAVPILDYRHRLLQRGYTNARLETFPGGYEKLVVASRSVFKVRIDGDTVQIKKCTSGKSKPQNHDNEPEARSINRARKMVFNIAMLNDFRYFVTWTLDQTKISREDPKAVSSELKKFLHSQVRSNGLKYIVVPEYHKDGRGIHMHGLLSGSLELAESGKRTPDGRIIYNMPAWEYGWSTCIEISGDRLHVAQYITKYICKDFKMIFGNFYYAGGGILRHPPTTYFDIDYCSIDADEYSVPEINTRFKYLTVTGGVVS